MPRSITRVFLVSLLLSWAAKAAKPQPVLTEAGELPQLEAEVEGKKVPLPLKHTHARIDVTGYVAEVEVTQTFGNPFDHPLEAIYVFPLPENSAVGAMKMVIGERVIEAEVQERQAARRTYEDAKQAGHTAALLEQERPNVFTQSVANIEPGTDIDVVVRYTQTLTYDAGEYEVVFPMVVGPRFFPGAPLERPNVGTGGAADTQVVADASRVSPRVLPPGMRSGHDISLEVVANAGLPITKWEVPTHKVEAAPTTDGTLVLRLAPDDAIPNRDFVLRYHVDREVPQTTLLSHTDERGGFFSLIVQPPRLDVDRLVGQRELVFVVDVSGSMSGVPLAMCQDAMEHALGMLRPVDTFNVITFAGRTGSAFAKAQPANTTNIEEALKFVRGMTAGGGTQMLDGIAAALSTEVEEGRHRYVFFMTDGYVGNEKQILDATTRYVKALEAKGQRARVFGFGVGSSTNRYLLDGLAKAGRGVTVYSTTREDPTLAVNAFFRKIDHPVFQDVAIDWGDLAVEQVYPTHLPDLFASRPLIVHGRYKHGGKGKITLEAKAGGKTVRLPVEVDLEDDESANPVLAPLWARAKIDWLERDLWAGEAAQAKQAITQLGLEFSLVTPYTSLVAVDRSKTVQGKLQTIAQPVEVPEGVDATMAGAHYYQPATSSAGGHAARKSMGFFGRGLSRGYGAGSAPAAAAPEMAADEAQQRVVSRPPMQAPRLQPKPRAKDKETESARQTLVVQVKGGLDEGTVQRLLTNKLASWQACANPTHSAYLKIRWFVAADGSVLQAKVLHARGADDALIKCLLHSVSSWRLPRPRGGTPTEVIVELRL